jgi:hypothetical protein
MKRSELPSKTTVEPAEDPTKRTWVRKRKQCYSEYLTDPAAPQRSLLLRAAAITAELERIELLLAHGDGAGLLDSYANASRVLLEILLAATPNKGS